MAVLRPPRQLHRRRCRMESLTVHSRLTASYRKDSTHARAPCRLRPDRERGPARTISGSGEPSRQRAGMLGARSAPGVGAPRPQRGAGDTRRSRHRQDGSARLRCHGCSRLLGRTVHRPRAGARHRIRRAPPAADADPAPDREATRAATRRHERGLGIGGGPTWQQLPRRIGSHQPGRERRQSLRTPFVPDRRRTLGRSRIDRDARLLGAKTSGGRDRPDLRGAKRTGVCEPARRVPHAGDRRPDRWSGACAARRRGRVRRRSSGRGSDSHRRERQPAGTRRIRQGSTIRSADRCRGEPAAAPAEPAIGGTLRPPSPVSTCRHPDALASGGGRLDGRHRLSPAGGVDPRSQDRGGRGRRSGRTRGLGDHRRVPAPTHPVRDIRRGATGRPAGGPQGARRRHRLGGRQ